MKNRFGIGSSLFAGVLLASSLIGCASSPPNPATTQTKTFRDFAKAYQDANTPPIDKLLKADELKQDDGYMSDTLRWCMLPSELTKYQSDLYKYCSNHGGQWTQNQFCVTPTGQFMFMAKLTKQGICSPAVDRMRIETKVLESTETPTTYALGKELAKFGFAATNSQR